MSKQHPFKWRHFQAETIVLCVRWYVRYALSSRDLEALMDERGLQVDHTTISRSRPMLRPRTGPVHPTASEKHDRFLEGR
jgi:transposase, IS6 family